MTQMNFKLDPNHNLYLNYNINLKLDPNFNLNPRVWSKIWNWS
jgi:hypothetical protein